MPQPALGTPNYALPPSYFMPLYGQTGQSAVFGTPLTPEQEAATQAAGVGAAYNIGIQQQALSLQERNLEQQGAHFQQGLAEQSRQFGAGQAQTAALTTAAQGQQATEQSQALSMQGAAQAQQQAQFQQQMGQQQVQFGANLGATQAWQAQYMNYMQKALGESYSHQQAQDTMQAFTLLSQYAQLGYPPDPKLVNQALNQLELTDVHGKPIVFDVSSLTGDSTGAQTTQPTEQQYAGGVSSSNTALDPSGGNFVGT